MNKQVDRPDGRTGLLANGSSGRWDVAVDEALDREEWSLEFDGPQVYLVFQLRGLGVLPAALRYLESGPPPSSQTPDSGEAGLTLGHFGSTAVSLLWDDEGFPRCFLVIGPKPRSTMRLSLDAEDIRMLIEALRQVVQNIPQAAGE